MADGKGPGDLSQIGLPTYRVNTSTLGLIIEDNEFAYSSRGLDLALKRNWNSDYLEPKMFGNGWAFRYGTYVQSFSTYNGGAYLFEGTGQSVFYDYTSSVMQPDGSYLASYKSTRGQDVNRLQAVASGGVTPQYFLYTEKQSKRTFRFNYAYDAGALRTYRLASIVDRNGNTVTFNYNGDWTLSSIVDCSGRTTSFTYDFGKRCTSMTTPNGQTATYAYDAAGNLIGTVDLLGTQTAYTYDANNLITSLAIGDKVTSFAYVDTGIRHRVTSITDASGAATIYGIKETGAVTVTDPLGRITEYQGSGQGTSSVSDPHLATELYWNSRFASYTGGLPTSLSPPGGGAYSVEYDAAGNVIRYTDPLGNETNLAYDGNDNLTSVTDPSGNIRTFAYDGKGNLTSMTSPRGKITTFAYDELGQLTAFTDPLGNTTSFSYSVHGNLANVTDAHGNKTTFAYDSSGIELTGITDPNGNVRQFTYDPNRRLRRVTHPDGTYKSYTYDAFAKTKVTDENGRTHTLVRDKLLQVVRATDPLGNDTKRTYDAAGNLTTLVNALNKTTSMTYDSLDRRITRTDPLGGVLKYAYDSNSNLNGITDQKNRMTLFTFDSANQLTGTKDPLGRQIAMAYNASGRLTQTTNARGGVIGYERDDEGRIARKTYDGVERALYAYNDNGNLVSATDPGGTTSYTYDALNRVSRIDYPNGLAAAFTYDKVGNVTQVTYPGDFSVAYSYDARNRPVAIQWNVGTGITLTWDAANNLLSEARRPGQTLTTYDYDGNNLVTEILHKAGAAVIARMNYGRDATGNILWEQSQLPILGVSGVSSATGAYDAANQITSLGSTTFTSDLDGNLTGATGGLSFSGSYDRENRLISMTRAGTLTSYAYNGLGQRMNAIKGGETRNFHYDHFDRLLFETNAEGQVKVCYIYEGGRLAALKTGTGATYFYHYNHTGSTVALSSTTGAVVNAYDYEDFGKVTSKMEAVLNPFTFVGAHGVMDEGDGLFFMKNRYYHASLARFLQRDPAGFAGGFNLYRYVGNNPVNFIDPSGLDPWTPDSTRRAGESNYWPIQHGSGTTVHNISLGSVGDWVNTYGQNPYNPFNSLVSGIYSLSQGDVSGALYQFGIEAWDQTGGRASKFFQAFSTFMCAGSDRPADPNAPEGSGDWIINQENKRDAGIIIYEGAPSVDDGEPVIELDDEF